MPSGLLCRDVTFRHGRLVVCCWSDWKCWRLYCTKVGCRDAAVFSHWEEHTSPSLREVVKFLYFICGLCNKRMWRRGNKTLSTLSIVSGLCTYLLLRLQHLLKSLGRWKIGRPQLSRQCVRSQCDSSLTLLNRRETAHKVSFTRRWYTALSRELCSWFPVYSGLGSVGETSYLSFSVCRNTRSPGECGWSSLVASLDSSFQALATDT